MALPKVGNIAPQFTLPNQDGEEVSLKDYLGKKVLLYFYPKDDTPGCTTEACSIRDNIGQFKSAKMVVLGVSTDSVKSHKKFADKYGLPFTLLSDEDKKVVNKYGVWGLKKFMGREYMGTMRNSFLIDEEGRIEKVFEKVKPAEHVSQVLEG